MNRGGLSKVASAVILAIIIIICVIAGGAYYYSRSSIHKSITTTTSSPTTATVKTLVTPTATSTASSTTTITTRTTTSTSTTTQYVVVIDARGKEVRIPEPVTKVITLYRMATPFIYLLGAGSKFYEGWSWGSGFYELVDPNFKKKVILGQELSVEEIVKIRPQVVIASTWERTAKEVSQLEGLGVPVVCVKIESIKDIYNTIRMLGKIFQEEGRANSIINYCKSIVQEVKSRLANVTTKPKVLVLYYSGRHHSLRTFGGDMFQSKLIELAGGVNVAGNLTGKKGVNVEQVAKWDPDIILIIQYGVPASKALQLIKNGPAWQAIKAVKNGKVYVVPYDGENWIDPCPKWPLGLLWLAKVLHPQQFKDINITEVAAHFYKEFFNLSISKVHITGNLTVTTAKG